MATMHGDPLVERSFNEWKKEMKMKAILKMNPLDGSHAVLTVDGKGHLITNEEIFNYCRSAGFTLGTLTNLIPPHKNGKPEYIGNIYGFPLFIGGDGKFQVGDAKGNNVIDTRAIGSYKHTFDPNEEVYNPVFEMYGEDPDVGELCEHHFLARDVDDLGNKWWCKQCDERFPVHPDDLNKGSGRKSPDSFQVGHHLEDFVRGIQTLSEAAQQAGVSAVDFSNAITKTFKEVEEYRDVYSLGQIQPVGKVLTGIIPKRLSDPYDVEVYFQKNKPDPNIYNVFPDVVSIEQQPGLNGEITLHIHFCDESIQKVVIYP